MPRLALATLLCTLACEAAAAPLQLAGTDWCPYLCPDNAQYPGYLLEALAEVLPEAPHFQAMPWSRALQMARDGQIDGVIGAYAEESDGLLIGHEPIGWVSMHFYTRADSHWRYTGPASLEHLRVGLVQGYSYGPKLDAWRDAHLGDHQRVQILSGEQVLQRNLQKLLRGRIDVLLEDHRMVAYQLRQRGLRLQVRDAGQLPQRRPMYVALSPQAKDAGERLRTLDANLKRLREQDGWLPLARRYGLEPD
ncbi:MAG: hypothetical protein GAK45_01945 [Pseudomonas citronellolis]|nr:MAG: hypothetical protein GAK45_01945 [Pseudomonas citronellolis]